MTARVLVFALDACEVTIARQMAAAGRMPNLARLMARATAVETSAPPGGTFVSAIWPTLFTARRPVHHGYLCWKTFDPDGRERETSPRDADGTPFWETLSAQGKRVALIDVPHTWVSAPLNGIQLCEWAAHDRHFGLRSCPPELAGEIVDRYGLHPIAGAEHDQARQFAPCDWTLGGPFEPRDADNARAMRDGLRTGLERKSAASLELLDREHWDLFFTVIGETHCVGHQFWFLHDRQHEDFDEELAALLGDPVADIYERADAVLGEHLARTGADADVFVILSHGMGPHYAGSHVLDAVLRRLAVRNHESGFRGSLSNRAAKRVWVTLPRSIRRGFAPLVAAAARRVASRRGAVDDHGPEDRQARPFFQFPNNEVTSAIRLNVIGRELPGVLAPSDMEAVIESLTEDLLDLVNVASGRPAIKRVVRVEEVFPDAPVYGTGDLFVEWNVDSQTETLYSAKVGLVHVPYRHVRTGDHRPQGLLLMTGPGAPRPVADGHVPVENIAPTIAALLDVKLDDVDGVPIVMAANERAAVST